MKSKTVFYAVAVRTVFGHGARAVYARLYRQSMPAQKAWIIFLILGIALASFGAVKNVEASARAPMQQQEEPLGSDSWTFRGPRWNLSAGEAVAVAAILYDRTNSNNVFAATNQGVYFSGNGGESWQSRSSGLQGYGDLVVTWIAQDPFNAQVLYIATWGAGIYKSTNSGNDWTRLTDPVSLNALDANLLQEAGPDAPVIRSGGYTPGHGIPWFSPDEQPTMEDFLARAQQQPQAPDGYPQNINWTPARMVTINPGNSNEVYASIDGGNGLFVSTNAGGSWSPYSLNQGESGSARAFVFAPSNSSYRYAAVGTGVYRTTNGGASWGKVFDTGYTVFSIAVHQTNPSIALVSTWGSGLYRTDNAGASWTQVIGGSGGDDLYFQHAAFAPSNPNVVYATAWQKLYLSTNGGVGWGNASASFTLYNKWAVAIHPTQPETVLVGVNDFPKGGLYKRTTQASSFALKGAGMDETFVQDIEQDPANANILYAATWGAGAFRSDNGGSSWVALNSLPTNASSPVPYVLALEAVPGGSGTTVLYAATFYVDWGILRSTDRGNSWTMVSDVDSGDNVISYDLEAIGNDPNTLVAATYYGIEISSNGGYDWYNGWGLSRGMVLSVCEWGVSERFLAGTYGGGVYYSPNGWDWFESGPGMQANMYVYDVACSNNVPGLGYAGTLGVYRTMDYGQTWHLYTTGLYNDYVRGMDIVPSASLKDVYAATNKSGVFLSPRGGALWKPINTGLSELRTRAAKVVSTSPIRAFVGTNGLGTWDYTQNTTPSIRSLYLPTIYKSAFRFYSATDTYEPNNSNTQAAYLSSPGTYYSYIWTPSDKDWYVFNVSTLGKVAITLDDIPDNTDYDIGLYRSDGLFLGSSTMGSNTSEKIEFYPIQTGNYYVYVTSYSGSSNKAYKLGLAYNSAYGAGDINGRVTQGGGSVSGAPILMYYYNGYRWTRATTITDSGGYYHFRGAPGLPVGHVYQITYPNYEDTSQRLSYWDCYGFSGYAAGQTANNVCNFDVANVVLSSPSGGSTYAFPITFSWQKRSTSADSYHLELWDPVGSAYYDSGALGYVGSHTVSSRPSGFYTGTQYYWGVWLQWNNGYGSSYYVRSIYFSSLQASEDGDGMELKRAFPANHLPGLAPDDDKIEMPLQKLPSGVRSTP